MKKLLLIFFVIFGFMHEANAIDLRNAIQTDATKAIQDLYDLEKAPEIRRQKQFIKNIAKKIIQIKAQVTHQHLKEIKAVHTKANQPEVIKQEIFKKKMNRE